MADLGSIGVPIASHARGADLLAADAVVMDQHIAIAAAVLITEEPAPAIGDAVHVERGSQSHDGHAVRSYVDVPLEVLVVGVELEAGDAVLREGGRAARNKRAAPTPAGQDCGGFHVEHGFGGLIDCSVTTITSSIKFCLACTALFLWMTQKCIVHVINYTTKRTNSF